MFNPASLLKIANGADINDLPKKHLRNLQCALSWMTFPISVIDGEIGPNTRNAFAEFKADIGEGNPDVVSSSSIATAINRIKKTRKIIRSDVSSKKKTRKIIAKLCRNMGLTLDSQIAYVLATAQWETAHTFEPVIEAYWLSETWRRNNLRYYPFYGRGYVQLTWERNYKNYSQILKIDLVEEPKLALDPAVALFVLVHGFKLGVFTGRKIEQYINKSQIDFENARRCINGEDKWQEIKKIAEDYLETFSQ